MDSADVPLGQSYQSADKISPAGFTGEESGRVYVLSKYMQAFILRKSPQNLTAGVTLGECTLSFECNIALPGRQSRRSTARPETIVIALDFILNRTRLWHCQKVCLKIRNIIVIRATRTVKRAPAFSISCTVSTVILNYYLLFRISWIRLI